jgi:hypothetical protein
MKSVRSTIRYRSGPQAVIAEDERGDLYACTNSGPFARIPRPLLAPILARGWVAVEETPPQSLDALLRTRSPSA